MKHALSTLAKIQMLRHHTPPISDGICKMLITIGRKMYVHIWPNGTDIGLTIGILVLNKGRFCSVKGGFLVGSVLEAV